MKSLYGPLSVTNSKLTTSDGSEVILKGFSTHGIAWHPEYITEEVFDWLSNQGMNCIRLSLYTEEHKGYCTNGDRKALDSLIERGIQYAYERGMYVIIDWHTLSDNNPLKHLNDASLFFAELSLKYRDYDHLIYEICNEPNGDCTWDDIFEYASKIIPIIRENCNNIILVGTPFWSQQCQDPLAKPLNFENIMYTLHFYASTHGDFLIQRMKSALDAGLPMFVSEFNICECTGDGSIDYIAAKKWADLLNSYGISRLAWSLSNKKDESSVLKEDVPIRNWSNNDFKKSALWLINHFL